MDPFDDAEFDDCGGGDIAEESWRDYNESDDYDDDRELETDFIDGYDDEEFGDYSY